MFIIMHFYKPKTLWETDVNYTAQLTLKEFKNNKQCQMHNKTCTVHGLTADKITKHNTLYTLL